MSTPLETINIVVAGRLATTLVESSRLHIYMFIFDKIEYTNIKKLKCK